MIVFHEEEKQKQPTRVHQTLTLRTNIHITCEWSTERTEEKSSEKKTNFTIHICQVQLFVLLHLQLRRLSATFLRVCIFTPSECSGVTQIVLLFYFEAIVRRNREAESEHPESRVCVPKLKSCCAATTWESLLHSSECETEFRLIEGFVRGSALHAIPPRWTSPGRPVLLSLYSCACCSRLFSAVTAFPLMLLATNLLSSLSLCPPAGALWVTGSQRKSVIVLETCHWPRYDGSGTESIVGTPIEYLRPFANEVWQGIHARSHRRAAGRSRQWVSHLDETARSRKSAGYGRPALPRSPQRPPL